MFKDIILNQNRLWKRETERFVELLFPHFGGYKVQIKAHELSDNPDYVEIQNFGAEKSYNICFKVLYDEEGIRLEFNSFPGFETADYESLPAGEYERRYGTKLEIDNFDLAKLDNPTTVQQFVEFLENGTVPDLK